MGERGKVSGDPWQSPATRRDVVGTLMRALMNTAVLILLYYLLPLDLPAGQATLLWLVLGLIVFVGLVALQLRSILGARHPGLRAVEALAAAVPLFVLVFASTYLLLAGSQPQAFTEPLNRTDALYFAMAVFSTVGFGDIAPRTNAARLITTVQMMGNLVVFGLLARVIVGAVHLTRQRRAEGTAAAEDVR